MLEERIKRNLEVLAALADNGNKSRINGDILSQYTGWGGLREAIFTPSVYRQLKLYLTDDEISSIKKTLTSAYYTPELLVKFIWTTLLRMGFRKGEVLEPAIGTGIFLDNMPLKIRRASNVDAIRVLATFM